MLAFVIALFSSRVRAIFFAMITLAVASAVAVLVSQLSWLTGGEDGMNILIPRELTPAFRTDIEIFGTRITGRILNYYLVFIACTALFLLLLRIVNSPFGRVLQAIRENAFRAEAVGYRVVIYRTVANLPVGGGCGAGGVAVRDLAALCRARHHAEHGNHDRHSADGGDRRHGHDLGRGGGGNDLCAGAEQPAKPDGGGIGSHRRPATGA